MTGTAAGGGIGEKGEDGHLLRQFLAQVGGVKPENH